MLYLHAFYLPLVSTYICPSTGFWYFSGIYSLSRSPLIGLGGGGGASASIISTEPVFLNLLRSPGIDSQPDGIDSWLLKHLQIRALDTTIPTPQFLCSYASRSKVCGVLKMLCFSLIKRYIQILLIHPDFYFGLKCTTSRRLLKFLGKVTIPLPNAIKPATNNAPQ